MKKKETEDEKEEREDRENDEKEYVLYMRVYTYIYAGMYV